MERLAHLVIARRRYVIAAWIALTIVGVFSAQQLSSRWFQSFSIPGYSAYESGQRIQHTFGNGSLNPVVLVAKSDSGPATTPGVRKAFAAAAAKRPGSRVSSWFSTHNPVYLSKDRTVAFEVLYPPGEAQFNLATYDDVSATLKRAAPAGVDDVR